MSKFAPHVSITHTLSSPRLSAYEKFNVPMNGGVSRVMLSGPECCQESTLSSSVRTLQADFTLSIPRIPCLGCNPTRVETSDQANDQSAPANDQPNNHVLHFISTLRTTLLFDRPRRFVNHSTQPHFLSSSKPAVRPIQLSLKVQIQVVVHSLSGGLQVFDQFARNRFRPVICSIYTIDTGKY